MTAERASDLARRDRRRAGVLWAELCRSALQQLSFGVVLAASGCFLKRDAPVGAPVIEELTVEGSDAIDHDAVIDGLATQESPAFLFWQGVVYEYEVLDEALLQRDLERVERYYRARGYYEAKVTAARVITTAPEKVRVHIVVTPGLPVRIPDGGDGSAAVQLDGLETIDDPRTVARIISATPTPGAVLDEADYERAKAEMRRVLADRGYAFAKVSGRVDVDLGRHTAQLRFDIDAGQRAIFGEISIEGLTQVPETKVRQSLFIAPGEPYSASALEDARRALVNLGVFASVNVEADTSAPQSRVVPVKFSVRETAPRTLRLGGGARLDALALSANLSASWEHRNFLGGLRHFSIEARPGIGLFPTRMSNFPNLEAPSRAMLQGDVQLRFAQPSFIEDRTRGLASVSLEMRPLLYADTQPTDPVLGFLELAARTGLERPFLSHHLFITPSLNFQLALPLDYRQLTVGDESPPLVTRDFDTLLITYPELVTRLDLRDDPLDSRSGLLLSNSLQLALPELGGSISDVRIRPEARFYVTRRSLTLAVRLTTGLLFPQNYAQGGSVDSASLTDKQALLFRGFFSGGPFSNRGYAFQGVGRQGLFTLSTDPRVRCSGADAIDDPRCRRPIGGLTLWEASAELRFRPRLLDPLGAVLFLDASDVRFGRAEYAFDQPHLAPGVGLRYPTPVGPVRLDVGLRVLELLGKEDVQGLPPTLFGAPVTVHLAVGQAF